MVRKGILVSSQVLNGINSCQPHWAKNGSDERQHILDVSQTRKKLQMAGKRKACPRDNREVRWLSWGKCAGKDRGERECLYM